MKNQLDERLMLNVFEKISKQGEKTSDGYQLEGMRAFTTPDGYTAYLEFHDLTLTLGFHSQYHFDYPDSQPLKLFKLEQSENEHLLAEFVAKAEQINAQY